MWLSVKFFDVTGAIISESGRYDFIDDALKGQPVRVPTLLPDDQLKVYETKPGLSEGWAAQLGLEPGPSFHFVLNDVIYKDNRIPPRGFTNAAFKSRNAAPAGYAYEDGQFWDDTPYRIPEGAAEVEVTLYYQTASWEYIKFLVEENRTNDWGDKLYEVWTQTGYSSPVAMDALRAPIESRPMLPAWDVNQNGVVDILDVVIVGSHFGQSPPKDARADVNKDRLVNILDLALVAGHFGERTIPAGPPGRFEATSEQLAMLRRLSRQLEANSGDNQTIAVVQNLLRQLLKEDPTREPLTLYSNYPNPANPETWLPYYLHEDAELIVALYDTGGRLIRALDLGYKRAGDYRYQDKAAYWDGRDSRGQRVASGVYFYVFHAGGFVKKGKITILK
jgi:hypothetical protein